MLLNVKLIRETPGARIPFDFTMDLSAMPFYGEFPLPTPVRVKGELYNRAGMLILSAVAEITLETLCARCAKPISVGKSVPIEQLLADELQDEENDDIVLIVDDIVDVSQIAEEAVILDMDMIHLCKPDCKGLCHKCGTDLNQSDCECAAK